MLDINNKLLSKINPHKLEDYIRSLGWINVDKIEGHANIWRKDNDFEILVPPTSFENNVQRLFETIHLLSKTQEKDVEVILKDINLVHSDLIRVKGNRDTGEDGSITLEKGKELISNTEDLIKYTAASIYKTTPFVRGKLPKEIEEFMKKTRLGQTEVGSFIATIYIPFDFSEQTFPEFNIEREKPYGRKVIENMSTKINTLKNVIADFKREENKEIFRDAIVDGVNGNICSAIVGLSKNTLDGQIDIGLSLSPVIESEIEEKITIEPELLPSIEVAYEYYSKIVEIERVTLEGHVLKMEKDSIEALSGQISLWTKLTKGWTNVHIQIPEADQHLAIECYENNIKVKITGDLSKEGKFWWLKNTTSLETIQ